MSSAHGHEHNDMAHVASKKTLLGVFVALLVLTVLTVMAAGLGINSTVELWIALIITTIKVAIVGLFFMHLRHDKPFNVLIFLSAFMFVAVFLGFAMMDTTQYNDSIIWEEKNPANQ